MFTGILLRPQSSAERLADDCTARHKGDMDSFQTLRLEVCLDLGFKVRSMGRQDGPLNRLWGLLGTLTVRVHIGYMAGI